MGNINIYFKNKDGEQEWLGSFNKMTFAEIFVEALIDKGCEENKIIYEF